MIEKKEFIFSIGIEKKFSEKEIFEYIKQNNLGANELNDFTKLFSGTEIIEYPAPNHGAYIVDFATKAFCSELNALLGKYFGKPTFLIPILARENPRFFGEDDADISEAMKERRKKAKENGEILFA